MMIDQVSNRYKILSLIGQGGMADVYRAQDVILNRIVAIKILRQKLNDDAMALVRFQREASAASRLSHPNVVDIYDVGEYDGLHYIVMEYIRGRTLKQLVSRRGALSVEESLYIMRQLTSAVESAHAKHIIHRDIKPQNVLVKDDGTVKITDFGIAVAADSVQLTLNNAVMGSAHYLAPETAQGKEPNPQIDIYSLGIVMYELLTGNVPFTGKTPTEIALKHLREKFPYPRNLQPSIPQSVENIVLKATAKNPEDRYQSASMMLYDLNHCLDEDYKYMKRLSFDRPYGQEIEEEEKPKVREVADDSDHHLTRRTIINIVVGGAIVILVTLLLFFGSLALGIIKISGMFGYETMPNIIGMSEEDAMEELVASNFDIDLIEVKYEVSDEVEKGQVVKAQYKAGATVKTTKKMEIIVSKGPSFLVEDYTDRNLQEVLQEFNNLGLNIHVNLEYEGSKDTDPGIIIGQKGLKAGKRIDPDANNEITFVVSEYPSIVISSDIIGRDVDKVKKEFNDLGIAVITKPIDGIGANNTVVDVLPGVGSTYVQEGTDSVVTLYYD